jgi:hypothetical protein
MLRARGGNRLPEGHEARGRPPIYERVRAFGDDPERRDRRQRERVRRAAELAAERGELDRILHRALIRLLEYGDDTCRPVWPALATIGRDVGGYDERTAGRWMAALGALGWVEKVHRYRFRDGHIEGDSNLWRVIIPAPLRALLEEREDAARSRSAKGRPTRRAPQNGPGRAGGPRNGTSRPPGRETAPAGGSVVSESNGPANGAEAVPAVDCPACGGSGFTLGGRGQRLFCVHGQPRTGPSP